MHYIIRKELLALASILSISYLAAIAISGWFNNEFLHGESQRLLNVVTRDEIVLPSYPPSKYPSVLPSYTPSKYPSVLPSYKPSNYPSVLPSYKPSKYPSVLPSYKPSKYPSVLPSYKPSKYPSVLPSYTPSKYPSVLPSYKPSKYPSVLPSYKPSKYLSVLPSYTPSKYPSVLPSYKPSKYPSVLPSYTPSKYPSVLPSYTPSKYPSVISSTPSQSFRPSVSVLPSFTSSPSSKPSSIPSSRPTSKPSTSNIPSTSFSPTKTTPPSTHPSERPSSEPSTSTSPSRSFYPSAWPSLEPSLNPAATYRKVLAIRVNAADLSTTAPSSKLSATIFENDFSFSSQYEKCSSGKLIFVPFRGSTTTGKAISNGVGEVTIMDNANGTSAAILRESAKTAAIEKYGDLASQFDNVILCLPPGALIGRSRVWVGYAYYYHWQSVMNDLHCTYPSALMHEIGHNLGLAHSDEDYDDQSCMMGYSYEQENGPEMCFNGAKSWQLGWYSDGHVSINALALTDWEQYKINLIGVANFDERSNQTVIIQITGTSSDDEYYIAFNRKTSFNSGTLEGGDQVLVTSRAAGQSNKDSTLEAYLSDDDEFFIHNAGDKSDVLIRVESINLFASPGYASVYVAKYHNICYSNDYCNDYDSCTVDTCDYNLAHVGFPKNSGSCVYETLPCTECGARISVRIVTNAYPENTTWSIVNFDKNIIMLSGGPYSEQNTVYDRHKCLELGNYQFNIVDSKDEALCCNPEYTLSIQGKLFMQISEPLSFRQLDTRLVEKVFVQNNDFGKLDGKVFDILCTEEECVDYDACTADIYDPETRLCTFEPLSTCMNATKFTVNITTDNHPEETTWSIMNLRDRKVVLTGGPYVGFGRKKKNAHHSGRRLSNIVETSNNNNSHVVSFQLEKGLYQFLIHDEFGDGMCCDEGPGGYGVSLNDVEVFSGGQFDSSEISVYDMDIMCTSDLDCDDSDECTYNTCKEETCIYSQMPCKICGKVTAIVNIYTDWFPEEISWIISRGDTGFGEVVMSGNSYSDPEFLFYEDKCLEVGSYTFSIFDSGGNGICCDSGEGYYTITLGDDQILKGGNFQLLEEIPFVVDIYPSSKPSLVPSTRPSDLPSNNPSSGPTNYPTLSLIPSSSPSINPSKSLLPSYTPSKYPSVLPSNKPSKYPSVLPSYPPSKYPSVLPSYTPSKYPSVLPSYKPSKYPSVLPSYKPSNYPSVLPSYKPSKYPSVLPSYPPSKYPSVLPSYKPSKYPSVLPSYKPSKYPSLLPSYTPTLNNTTPSISSPENSPNNVSPANSRVRSLLSSYQSLVVLAITTNPLSLQKMPSDGPSLLPAQMSSTIPSNSPSNNPSYSSLPSQSNSSRFNIYVCPILPSAEPTSKPFTSLSPSDRPSKSVSPSTIPSAIPSVSQSPSLRPTYQPSALFRPSASPSFQSISSVHPSKSIFPSEKSTNGPSISFLPSSNPTLHPSISLNQSFLPSKTLSPSSFPSYIPSISLIPSIHPTYIPSTLPTLNPTLRPSISISHPTPNPTFVPTSDLTLAPSKRPTNPPSYKPVSSLPTLYPTLHDLKSIFSSSDSPSFNPSSSLTSSKSTIFPNTMSPSVGLRTGEPQKSITVKPIGGKSLKPTKFKNVTTKPVKKNTEKKSKKKKKSSKKKKSNKKKKSKAKNRKNKSKNKKKKPKKNSNKIKKKSKNQKKPSNKNLKKAKKEPKTKKKNTAKPALMLAPPRPIFLN